MKHRAAGADCDLVDIGSLTVSLEDLVLMRKGGADATLYGHFVDLNGRIVSIDGGTTWTYTGTIGSTAKRLTGAAGVFTTLTEVPEVAVGFRGYVTVADVIYCGYDGSQAIPAALETDMQTTPLRYSAIANSADVLVLLGRG